MRFRNLLIPLILLLVAGGCGEVAQILPDAPDVDPGGDELGFTLTTTTPKASFPIDGRNRVSLEIHRTGGFTGAIAIAAASPPAGVTVDAATIPEGATTVDVVVGAAAPLVIGDTVTVGFQATGDAVPPQTVTLTDAPITGQPGSLDPAFGPGTGLATISFGGDDDGVFSSLDVINGAIVAIGSGTGGLGAVRVASTRFTAAGVVDTTWNQGALSRTGFGTSSGDFAVAVATGQQVDGRSVAIGFHDEQGQQQIALVRYSLTGGSGGVDFGSGGKSLVDVGTNEVVRDGLVLPNSQIVAVGQLDGHFMVARMSSSGFLDTAFATPSGFERAVLGTTSEAKAVAVDNQARLVVAGTLDAGGQKDLVIRRYLVDGTHDTTFGTTGQIIVSGTDNEDAVAVVAVGNAIVVAATANNGATQSFRVRRFLASGEPDMRFGTQGLAEIPVAAATQALDMVVLPDGRVVVLGNAGGKALLVRFTRDGAIDTFLGTAGTGVTELFIGDSGLPASLAVYSEHLIVIGGGNQGGTPGPGTFGVVARMWM